MESGGYRHPTHGSKGNKDKSPRRLNEGERTLERLGGEKQV